jgi:ABC-type transport system involved in multi-copper enzyme maturation permease subunit
MNAVLTLCRLTLMEYNRRKLFVVTLIMMLLVAGTGLIANPFTTGSQSRLLRDLALLLLQFYLVFYGMALGAAALPAEIERKTLYAFLSKPISRTQYLWGKFLAITLLILLNALVLGLELTLIVKVSAGEFHWMVLAACFLTAIEAIVAASFCIFFSTFMTVAVTFAAMVLLYVIGSLSHVYILTVTADNKVMRFLLVHLKSLLPYFDYFSIRSAATHDYLVSWAYLGMTTVYGFLYMLLAMLLAEAAFSWKDL